MQSHQVVLDVGGIKSVCIYGGVPKPQQKADLRAGAEVRKRREEKGGVQKEKKGRECYGLSVGGGGKWNRERGKRGKEGYRERKGAAKKRSESGCIREMVGEGRVYWKMGLG